MPRQLPELTAEEYAHEKMRFEAAVLILRYMAAKPFPLNLSESNKTKRQELCKKALLWVDDMWEMTLKSR